MFVMPLLNKVSSKVGKEEHLIYWQGQHVVMPLLNKASSSKVGKEEQRDRTQVQPRSTKTQRGK